MIKLVNIELKKVFMHKNIYIILIIMTLFCFLNNYLYHKDYDNDGRYKYENNTNINKEIKKYSKELTKYNLNNDEDKNMYISIQSKIDLLKIKQEYNNNTWQYNMTDEYLENDIYNINYYQYIEKDDTKLSESRKEYEKKFNKFKKDNWKYFIKIDKKNLENQKDKLTKQLSKTKDKKEQEEIKNNLEELKRKITIINYRLSKNIDNGNNYLNRALEEYSTTQEKIINYQNKELTYQEKIEYNKLIQSNAIDKYIIENKTNIEKENTLNYCLRSILDDYELFIIIIILMTTSILISEEFNKGTIKLLLIKPFSRNKILLSKLITSLIVITITIGILITEQIIIGGISLGFNSLKIPVAVYNFNKNTLELYNIYIYMLTRILSKIPEFIIILILNYLLAIVIDSTVAPFALTFLTYTVSEIINNIIIKNNIKFMQYFITINWNFKNYLFGGMPEFKYINLKKSILIYIIYVIIIIYAMFKSFNKKNIKNI